MLNIPARLSKAEEAIRTFALRFPEVHEDFPWGERALKVKAKVFVFMRCDENGLSVCIKLRDSHGAALSLPFTKPSNYGLGKHGWVVAKFAPTDDIPIDLICGWVEESYRCVAPKSLVARIDEPAVTVPTKKRATATKRKLSPR